ncbi:MAG: TatD family hydrolase [Candidatus Woesearchaeota archaeon]
MQLVDVHCHLDHPFFCDLDKVILRAKAAKLHAIITNGSGSQSNRHSLRIASTYPMVKAALGLDPLEVDSADIEAELEFISQNQKQIVAIGEVGLDSKYSPNPKQRDVLNKIICLAEAINKPLIVHSRGAEAEIIEILRTTNQKVVMHCFGGTLKLAKKCLDNNWLLSIPTSITRSTHFQAIVKNAPLNQLLTETDAPFQAPFKQQRNEPCFVGESIKTIAALKGIEPEQAAHQIFLNYQQVFRLQ